MLFSNLGGEGGLCIVVGKKQKRQRQRHRQMGTKKKQKEKIQQIIKKMNK